MSVEQMLEQLARDDWSLVLAYMGGTWELRVVSAKTGTDFTYSSKALMGVVLRAWAGEPGD